MNLENGSHGFHGIVYYANWELRQQNTENTRPLNVVFLTSVRDTGTCDRNGSIVETGAGVRYMEGAIERTVRETYPSLRGASGMIYPGGLVDRVRVVGVITDDTERDMRRSDYSALPDSSRRWIYPFGLTTPDGELVRDMTYNIPSAFRLLPLGDKEGRGELKREFEWSVLQKTKEFEGDIIVSDHYMAQLDYLWGEFGLSASSWDTFRESKHPNGRILNIHPAVTVENHPHCFRGKTPTADAIERAKSGIPTKTGATLHIVGEKIDEGPAIAYVAETPVFPTDEPQWLRYRNYTSAKLPLFVAGLLHYTERIYPYIDSLNLSALEPFQSRYTRYSVIDINTQFQEEMLGQLI